MKSRKPMAPWLPGVYGKMTREEFDALSDSYDREFSLIDARSIPNDRPHPKKRGRPRKPARAKAKRVLLTIEPKLLAEADAAAGKYGMTRAGLIQAAVRDWLERQPRRRSA